jgi:hypothetical protein
VKGSLSAVTAAVCLLVLALLSRQQVVHKVEVVWLAGLDHVVHYQGVEGHLVHPVSQFELHLFM